MALIRITHNTKLLSLRTCALLFALSVATGTLGYHLIEGYGIGDALYMSVITLSTVGFGEVRPLSTAGRLFTSGYVIANLAITALFVTQLTQQLVEGGLGARLRRRIMTKEIAGLEGHVIVCGAGRYGAEVVEQLRDTEETVVLVERDPEHIEPVASQHPELLYVLGDATDDGVLGRAGVSRAKALIATLGNDSDNAFAVLTARELSAGLVIIAKTEKPESRSKMMRVGADHVVQVEQIGGFFMSALVRQPSAVEFFRSLAGGPTAEVGFLEVAQAQLPVDLRDSSLREMNLRQRTGVSVVALREGDGSYAVNPDADRTLSTDTSLIALGDRDQLRRLRALLLAVDGEAPRDSTMGGKKK